MCPEFSPLSLDVIDNVPQLENIARPWEQLWQSVPAATSFQSPAWLIPWCKHIADGDVFVAAIQAADQLVALAPLVIYRANEAAPRQCMLLGSGNSDYLDVLVHPDAGPAVREKLLEAVVERATDYDVLDLQELPPASFLTKLDSPFVKQSSTAESLSLYLNLAGKGKTLEDYVPAEMAKSYRYAVRRANKDFSVEISSPDTGSLSMHLDILFKLHQRRWETRNEAGVLTGKAMSAFHREAAARLFASGLLRLYTMRFDGQPVASFYGFSHGKRTWYYLGGFDPEYQKYSPGTILVGYAIERALEEECTEFDFLRGQERYKYKWGAAERTNTHVKYGVCTSAISLEPVGES